MAANNLSELEVDSRSLWCDSYTGTEEALVRARLARADQFPGIGRTRVTYYAGATVRQGSHAPQDEGYLSIARRGKRSFRVTVGLPQGQQKRRDEQRKAITQQRAAAERAAKELALVPKTEEGYRTGVATDLRILLKYMRSRIGPVATHGFRYSDDELAQFDDMAEELLDVLIYGRTTFSAARQQAAVVRIKAEVANADPSFSRMMAGLIAVGPEVVEGLEPCK